MTLKLDIPAATESLLLEYSKRTGQDVLSLVTAAVLEKFSTAEFASDEQRRYADAEWAQAFERWVQSHAAISREADDSRESLYSGRDE